MENLQEPSEETKNEWENDYANPSFIIVIAFFALIILLFIKHGK